MPPWIFRVRQILMTLKLMSFDQTCAETDRRLIKSSEFVLCEELVLKYHEKKLRVADFRLGLTYF